MELAFSLRRASLTGLLGRAMGAGGGGIDVSGMAVEDCQAKCKFVDWSFWREMSCIPCTGGQNCTCCALDTLSDLR